MVGTRRSHDGDFGQTASDYGGAVGGRHVTASIIHRPAERRFRESTVKEASMPQTTVTCTPAANHDQATRFFATAVPLTGDHRITITSDGAEDDTAGHFFFLAIAAAALLAGCAADCTGSGYEPEAKELRYPPRA
jgi:hypothetical protein